jgi:hypothetical protein
MSTRYAFVSLDFVNDEMHETFSNEYDITFQRDNKTILAVNAYYVIGPYMSLCAFIHNDYATDVDHAKYIVSLIV